MPSQSATRFSDGPTPGRSPAAHLGASRARVLELLRHDGREFGAREVAERMGLHTNTARFHLDGLVEADLATRGREDRQGPGRPRVVYAATAAPSPPDRRNYQLLAQILAGFLAATAPEPATAAADAGRAWGRYLTERPAPFQRPHADEAVDRLTGLLDEIGFASEPTRTGSQRHIRLRHCPFLEAAKEHQDVVCAVHLGLMQGSLAEMNAPLTAPRLDPFVEPGLCLAQLERQNHRGGESRS